MVMPSPAAEAIPRTPNTAPDMVAVFFQLMDQIFA